MIIITSDHGGLGNTHGGNSRRERRVWSLIHIPNFGQTIQIESLDPGSYETPQNPPNPERMETAVLMEDLGVTMLEWLVAGSSELYDLDGKDLSQINGSTSARLVSSNLFSYRLSENTLHLSISEITHQKISVYNSSGQLEYSGNVQPNISLTLTPGIYFIQFASQTQKICVF